MEEVWHEVPTLDNRFICVADLENPGLAAVVSSHFTDSDTYLPLFSFPNVAAGFLENPDFSDDHYISHVIGNEAAVLINNAVARMGTHKHILFVGLDANQKSYLLHFFRGANILEIDSLADVEERLNGIGIVPSSRPVLCREEDILEGLMMAKRENRTLVIDEVAEKIRLEPVTAKGIIVIEDCGNASTVVAVNYAFSIGAEIKIVEAVPRDVAAGVKRQIQHWRDESDRNELIKVLKKVRQRIGYHDFSKYEYATFFTGGLPYSLYLDNSIPISYVHIRLRPDLFVFNSILFESISRFYTAVVFSPLFFKETEETGELISLFGEKGLHVKALLGSDATVNNLEFYGAHYPYDILHICSHGGETDGYYAVEEFTDRDGIKHTVEYDEVVGFSPTGESDLIAVNRKTFFRKFDGFPWLGDELGRQSIPSYVFEDMRKALYQSDELNKDVKRVPTKGNIASSCMIQCYDSIHQGTFHALASHSSPFIFNNTCWSWYEVVDFFLAGGVKGYIGTLWNIDNDAAVVGAKAFYTAAFDRPVIMALHEALQYIKDTPDRNIYAFWGLHFSTLAAGTDAAEGRYRTLRELVRSFFSWTKKVHTTKSAELKKNSIEVVRKIHQELISDFKPEELERLEAEISAKIGAPPPSSPQTRGVSSAPSDPLGEPFDYPTRYREKE